MIPVTCDPEGKLDRVPLDQLEEFQGNLKSLGKTEYAKLKQSITEKGFIVPCFAWRNGSDKWKLLDGHQRVRVIRNEGWEIEGGIPIVEIAATDDRDAKEKLLAIVSRYGRVEGQGLYEFLDGTGIDLEQWAVPDLPDLDLDSWLDEFMRDPIVGEGEGAAGGLIEKFIVPPFSVLDSRQGYWQDRKRQWLAMGIQSELGRGEDAVASGSLKPATTLGKDGKTVRGDGVGRPIEDISRRAADKRSNINDSPSRPEWATGTGTENMAPGTSIFDPVLAELAYRWFCPPGGMVLDPFAGGSVRGVVASRCGRQYVGVDLSETQILANRGQEDICFDPIPTWIHGDSRTALPADIDADLIFSCPPYGDLEVYSDDEDDISTMPHDKFIEVYREIIAAACARLKDDRFAAFVVGDFRDKKGNYRNFISDTIQAFLDADPAISLYNEAILVNAIGSLPIRAGKQFQAGRKLGKLHQNVLVFCKGDGRRATEAIGDVECGEIEAEDSEYGELMA
jgi:hypothetical protein